MTPTETYEKILSTIKERFRIMESFSIGNRASWHQEVEYLLNKVKLN